MIEVYFRSSRKLPVNIGNPFFISSCALNDGTILLTDTVNRRLTRLSPADMSVTESLLLRDYPIDVFAINGTDVAVELHSTFVSNHGRFALVSVQKTMQIVGYIECNSSCSDIKYPTRSLSEETWRPFCVDDVTEAAPFNSTTPANVLSGIYVSSTLGLVYVTCNNSREQSLELIAVDTETKMKLWKSKLNISDPITDLSDDGCGTIFTLSKNKIQQFGRDGLKISEISVVESCNSLSFDKFHTQIIATHDAENYITLIPLFE